MWINADYFLFIKFKYGKLCFATNEWNHFIEFSITFVYHEKALLMKISLFPLNENKTET